MSPLRQPPPTAELSSFPAWRLDPAVPLFRIHQRHHDPIFCASGRVGRFSLRRPRGTLYLALNPAGALIEALQDVLPPMPTALLGRGEVDARALSILHVTAPFTLADCTVAHAAAYGLTGEIHSSTRADHGRTRAWAAAFHRASFGGVRYFVRHDPSQSSIGIDFRRAETAAGAAI